MHFCHVINNVKDDKLENEWIAGPEKKYYPENNDRRFPKTS